MRLFILFVLIVLSSCASINHYGYVNCCQKDYWDDYKTDIFARKNCVGDTGRWIGNDTATNGYYCLGPKCVARDTIICKGTCDISY